MEHKTDIVIDRPRQVLQLVRTNEYRFVSGNPASVPANTTSNSTVVRSYNSDSERTVEVRPKGFDWQKLIRENRCATTTLVGTHRKLSDSHFSYDFEVKKLVGVIGPTYYWHHVHEVWSGSFVGSSTSDAQGPPNLLGTSMSSVANNKALGSFIEKATKAQRSFTGLQYLGESREAIRMLTGGTRSIAKYTQRYLDRVMKSAQGSKRRWKKQSPRRRPPIQDVVQSDIANHYLGYTYGITPLVSDIRSAAETLAKIHDRDGPLERAPISAIGSENDQTYPYGYLGTYRPAGFVSGLRFLWTDKNERLVIYKGSVSVDTDGIGGAARFLGLDRYSFLPTLYELVPWSFVNDYVNNTNDIINAWSFPRSDVSWMQRTFVNRVTRSLSLEPDYNLASGPWILVTSNLQKPNRFWTCSYVDRNRYTGTVIPDFQWEIPGAKQWRKWLNMATLARNERHVLKIINNLLRG